MLTVDFEKLRLQPDDWVLDIGCGFGRHAYKAGVLGAHVIACDLGLGELKEVQNTAYAMRLAEEIPKAASIDSVNGDITKLPFEDGTFDKIVASEVLEHIPNDVQAFTELNRVLRPGGIIAVTVPAFLPEKICWALSDEYHAPKAEGGHVRIYTKKEINSKLLAAGLAPICNHQAHGFHSPYWWLRCLVGPNNDENGLVKTYHKFLCWELMNQPNWARNIEDTINCVLGKSLVVYAFKKKNLARS